MPGMRRFLVFIVAAAGAAFWWRQRGKATVMEPPVGDPLASTSVDQPPQLGGEVSAELLEMLACPLDKASVSRIGHYLVCSQCGRRYPIRDGIPVMLIDEALAPESSESKP